MAQVHDKVDVDSQSSTVGVMSDFDNTNITSKKSKEKKNRNKHFIGIHLGVGSHSLKMQSQYKILCRAACGSALRILRRGGTADDAVIAATVVLENSGKVNTGKGSNLTLHKTVECDAGFMNGDGFFGGVGAVDGVPNPILIAKKITELQLADNKLSCGRVPPTLLVGPGARDWAKTQQIPTCDPQDLVTAKAKKRYAIYLKKLSEAEKVTDSKKEWMIPNHVSDTIGVVALDSRNKVAATVSSGGNWLKFPGRVGHCPQYGAGCWAINVGPLSNTCVAVSTTGVGEMLSKVKWAAECGNLLQSDQFPTPVQAVYSSIKEKFLESNLLEQYAEPKIVGMIGLVWDGQHGEFVWGHSSQSFVVAFGGSHKQRINTIFSNLAVSAHSIEHETSIKVEGVVI